MISSDFFANWCRKLRSNYPRSYFAPLYGLDERAVQDLEQARSLPSRTLVVLLREVAKEARPELAALDEARSSRNFNRRIQATRCGSAAIK